MTLYHCSQEEKIMGCVRRLEKEEIDLQMYVIRPCSKSCGAGRTNEQFSIFVAQ